jgi:type II secretory pathway pseudopilin PulG
MRTRSGVGRTEVIVGIVVVVVLLAVATPLLLGRSDGTRRSEVPLYLEKIKAAQLASMQAFQTYEACDPAPRGPTDVDANAVPWAPSRGFTRLAWEPDDLDAVYGSYRCALEGAGFRCVGTADVDGDGKRAVYEVTQDTEVTMTSDPDFY